MNLSKVIAFAGCATIFAAILSGCSGQNVSTVKTPAETKSFAGGPIPANSPWAQKLGDVKNAGNAVPKPQTAAVANQTSAPHSL